MSLFKSKKVIKTVKGVCDSFTESLEEIQKENLETADKLQAEINVKQLKHKLATSEVAEAETAIANIRQMFGKTKTGETK